MHKLIALTLVGVILLSSEFASCSRILSISMMSSKSHKNVYEPLLSALANRGHQVTIVSPIKSSGPEHKNIREIMGVPFDEMFEEFNFFEMKEQKIAMNPFITLMPVFEKYGKQFLKLPQIESVLNEKFDLVIFSGFMNECILGVLKYLGAPYILTIPFTAAFFHISPLGNPVPLSFMPNTFAGYSDRPTFPQRILNLITFLGFSGMFEYYYYPAMEAVYKEHFGQDSASVQDIMKNTSLILSNGHFSLNYPRALLPDVIDVGGMHCRPSQPLPKELDDFLTGSGDDGFIYFSMGSVVKGNTMPEKHRKIFLNVFSKLKQRVIWKWESDTMEGLPKNVKLSKWLPQQDVLGHPKIRMFITHGGLLSTEEAVYHGVPLIGFPMFGDQLGNMLHSEHLGFALSLDILTLTEDGLSNAIDRVLKEPKFKESVTALSAVFRDRPQKPLETAVFWTEYIIRHKGAVHLRSAGRDLNYFQYHSLDVIAFLLGSVFIALWIVIAILKFVYRLICGKSTSKSSKAKSSRHAKRD